MTHVDRKDRKTHVDWVSTFEITKAQYYADHFTEMHAKIPSDLLKNAFECGKDQYNDMLEWRVVGDTPYLFESDTEATSFVNELNRKFPDWSFRIPSPEEWDVIATETILFGKDKRPVSLAFRRATLKARNQGKKLDDKELQWEKEDWSDLDPRTVSDFSEDGKGQNPVGRGNPDYFGLYGANLEEDPEIGQFRIDDSGKVGVRNSGPLRLFATYNPPKSGKNKDK